MNKSHEFLLGSVKSLARGLDRIKNGLLSVSDITPYEKGVATMSENILDIVNQTISLHEELMKIESEIKKRNPSKDSKETCHE